MPNRFQRNSIGELVCRVPLQRGSLLKSIENLVKTIETSENAVMIPTLLRDKVRVDAWELLFVAKILKASILGHDDLVEFYMNHIHQNGLSTGNTSGQSAAQTPSAPFSNGQLTPNGCSSPALSPSLARQQSSPSMASPLLMSHPLQANGLGGHNRSLNGANAPRDQPEQPTNGSSSSSSTSSSFSSQTTTTTATGGPLGNQTTGPTTANAKSSSSSTTSWTTAVSQSQPAQQLNSAAASLTSGSPFNSAASSLSSAGTTSSLKPESVAGPGSELAPGQEANGQGGPLTKPLKLLAGSNSCDELQSNPQPAPPVASVAQDSGLLAARPLMSRLAQPPSLLQLTTTNNHINSVSELLSSSPMDPSLDSLSQHLISLQQQQQATQLAATNLDLGAGLSLSILTGGNSSNGLSAGEQVAPPPPLSSQVAPPTTVRHELRSSRSAGCLFRANSGASSPRTPATPYPQAETLAGAANQNGLVGDPTSLVKLLLQVEQLKASIVHVNTLLESVVDLYKKSIDNISQ